MIPAFQPPDSMYVEAANPITEKAACFPERPGATMMDMDGRAIDRSGIIPGCFTLAGAAQ
jgi:hypothetical protein